MRRNSPPHSLHESVSGLCTRRPHSKHSYRRSSGAGSVGRIFATKYHGLIRVSLIHIKFLKSQNGHVGRMSNPCKSVHQIPRSLGLNDRSCAPDRHPVPVVDGGPSPGPVPESIGDTSGAGPFGESRPNPSPRPEDWLGSHSIHPRLWKPPDPSERV